MRTPNIGVSGLDPGVKLALCILIDLIGSSSYAVLHPRSQKHAITQATTCNRGETSKIGFSLEDRSTLAQAPLLGDGLDIAWAPVSAALVQYLFGNAIFSGFALVEEILPGTDFIPTATICWFFENRVKTVSEPAPPPSSSPPPRSPDPPRRRRSFADERDDAIDV